MAKLTKAQQKVLLDSTIYQNDNEEVKASNHNDMLTDFIDSGMNESEPIVQANLNANNKKIVNLLDPTLDQDGATKKYVDITNAGSIQNAYATLAAMYADQINQGSGSLQFVLDASDDPSIGSGYAYYEYLGTTVGDLTDYRLLSKEEAFIHLTEPNTWYVNDGDAGDNANVGSDKFPFKTIQHAHDAMADGDTIIIQNNDFNQPSTPATTITKNATIIGYASNINEQGSLSGSWTITAGKTLMIDALGTSSLTFASSGNYTVELSNGFHTGLTSTSRRLVLIIKTSWVFFNDPIELNSIEGHNSIIDGNVNIGSGFYLSATNYKGDIIAGIDSTGLVQGYNSTIDGDVTVTGSLKKFNSVITGTETVSGTTTSRQAKVFDDSVEFKDKVSIGVSTFLNLLDVAGGMVVGSGVAGIQTAPADGLLVEGDTRIDGNLGINMNPTFNLDLTGNGRISGTIFANAHKSLSAGSAANPVYTYSADGDTGHYNKADDVLASSAGGVDALIITELLGVITNLFTDSYGSKEVSVDALNPPEGQHRIFQSDGTGTGDDGDIIIKITAGGVTKTTTLVDFSAI